MPTPIDELYNALKALGITTEPTDIAGQNAWYTASGEYLGTHGIEDGLTYLKGLLARVQPFSSFADQERALRFVRDAQIDLRRKLSNGERRDLLTDNTRWSREYIVAMVEKMADYDTPAPGVSQ